MADEISYHHHTLKLHDAHFCRVWTLTLISDNITNSFNKHDHTTLCETTTKRRLSRLALSYTLSVHSHIRFPRNYWHWWMIIKLCRPDYSAFFSQISLTEYAKFSALFVFAYASQHKANHSFPTPLLIVATANSFATMQRQMRQQKNFATNKKVKER